MRALLLEDSTTVARWLIALLRAHGYTVERYSGVTGARAACDGKTFDLYVIDESVQENERGGSASGLDFVLALRTWHPSARVIVTSLSDCRNHAIALGCTFVPKGECFGERFVNALRGLS